MSDSKYDNSTGNLKAQGDLGYHMTDKDKSEGTSGIVPIVKGGGEVESGLSKGSSDEQLGMLNDLMNGESYSNAKVARDDKDAIDESNIMDERTRGAGPKGGYTEPGDTEGLPENDGTSRIAS